MRFFSRPSLAEIITWLLLVILLGSTTFAHAQSEPVNLSNSPQRRAHAYVDPNEDAPDRNHGTGVRLGVVWSQARTAVRAGRLPAVFEAGAFHQHALGRVGSVQAELLFFHQRADSAAPAATGLRLPLLLVLNPFYNVSFHVGPQVQWQWNAAPATSEMASRAVTAPAPLSLSLVAGTEARVGAVRVGLRYGLPCAALSNLPDAGSRIGTAWKTGEVQAYLGIGF